METTDGTKKKMITGSEAVILSLINEGVDVLFGYPGGAIMPVYDAMHDYYDKLNHILTATNRGHFMPHRVMPA